jgi:hypothetical protein
MARNPVLGGNSYGTQTAIDLVPITPDDSNDLAITARGIRCKPNGTAGTLRITTQSGQVRNTYIGLGEVLPVIAVRVHATGTVAAGLEALI